MVNINNKFMLRPELKLSAGIFCFAIVLFGCRREATPPTSRPSATTSLDDAIFTSNESEVRRLLAAGADIDGRNKDGETPLNVAASFSNVKIVTMLLEKGAKVNAIDGRGDTPLTDAISQNNIDIVELLLHRGASVGMGRNRNPLQWAAFMGNPDIVSLLLAHGADPNVSSGTRNPPLNMAADSVSLKRSEIVKLLVAASAKLNERDARGETAITIAADDGHWDVVTLLAESGADVNVTNWDDGRTPLHEAALRNKIDVIRVLLAHGANVNAVNQRKRTPLDFALGPTSPDSPAKRETVEILKDAMQKAVNASQPAPK